MDLTIKCDIFQPMDSEEMNDKNAGKALKILPRVTSCMVRSRTVELAIIAGRSAIEIRQNDYEQAKRELTGETDHHRQQAVLFPLK